MQFYKKKVICRGDGIPYLIRYSLFSCRFFAIKIHNILISDYDCLHDHPWGFITLLLKGGYTEHTVKTYTILGGYAIRNVPLFKYYGAGSILYRPAMYRHKLELTKPVWSFVITFRKQREWGFWTKKGFVKWFNYDSNDTCDE